MAKIVLNEVTNSQNISNINSNFTRIAEALNEGTLWRDNPDGEPNQLENDIDVNGFNIYNAGNVSTTKLTVNGVDVTNFILTANGQFINSLASPPPIGSVSPNTGNFSSLQRNGVDVVTTTDAQTVINKTIQAISVTSSTPIALSSGGTGGVDATTAKINLGLNNVNNTSDANKPISTATQAALDLKANLAGAAFTGNISVTGNIVPNPFNGIVGTQTAVNANPGIVGEFPTNSASVGMTSVTLTNITSVLLTPGDWEVSGSVEYIPSAGATLGLYIVGVNDVSGVGAPTPFRTINTGAAVVGAPQSAIAPTRRYLISANTTVYLVGYVTFSGGTCTAQGVIRARRVR